jgi:dipeptidyl aminopeptidase/acylaminoacyl peptidase
VTRRAALPLAGALAAACALAAPPATAAAQGAPDTEIWLAPLRVEGGVAVVGTPVNVTNRPGYDNQPSFTPDGRAILYTAQDAGQTDVWRYDIATRVATPVTRTPESEYSPAVSPDGRWITVVRVEADSAQRLWRVPIGGRGEPQLLLRDVQPVGYFAWADANTLALFVLGAGDAPNMLQVARTRGGGRTDTIMSGVGRSLHRVPGTRTVSFVHAAAAPRVINVVDPATQAVRRVARPLVGSEDFAWLDGERLLMARDDSLFQHGPGAEEWRGVAALGDVGRVTRLAVSPRGDWLAFVAERAAPAPPAPPDTGSSRRR